MPEERRRETIKAVAQVVGLLVGVFTLLGMLSASLFWYNGHVRADQEQLDQLHTLQGQVQTLQDRILRIERENRYYRGQPPPEAAK